MTGAQQDAAGEEDGSAYANAAFGESNASLLERDGQQAMGIRSRPNHGLHAVETNTRNSPDSTAVPTRHRSPARSRLGPADPRRSLRTPIQTCEGRPSSQHSSATREIPPATAIPPGSFSYCVWPVFLLRSIAATPAPLKPRRV